jgi:hypothetical protein
LPDRFAQGTERESGDLPIALEWARLAAWDAAGKGGMIVFRAPTRDNLKPQA